MEKGSLVSTSSSNDASQVVLALKDCYTNRGLFAKNYLDNRLPELAEWHRATGLDAAYDAILDLYRAKAQVLNGFNEAQTEQDFIQPILDILWQEQQPHDTYQVQVTIPNTDARRQPDYAFFSSAVDRENALPRLGTLDYWRNVPCLGDAKRWSSSLDKSREYDENPSAQIVQYLYRSGVRWGLLTNGRIWRIYEREKSRTGGVYFEVNLEAMLKAENREYFKWFYLFFRAQAFQPDSEMRPFVERVFESSVEYAATVGERLKESVYEALRSLMNGFFEYKANGLDRHNPDDLALVHENSLIVLYRLLFILYAEDRNLLSRQGEYYDGLSLYRTHKEINKDIFHGKTFLPVSRRYWGHVTNLFQIIDAGFPEGGITGYNGGLFSPEKYPHIAHTPVPSIQQWVIGDNRLAEVIDMLAYQRVKWNKSGYEDIDYNSLAVQHLGSIYEGLLELQPQVAGEDLVEVLEDGKQIYKPAREVPQPRPIRKQPAHRIAEGEIYLTTNKGERKTSGSYYTPTYIVDFIVQHTVGALTEKVEQQVAVLYPDVQAKVEQYQKICADRVAQYGEGSNEVTQIKMAIEEEKRRLLEPYLSLRILDPAMGSGHFLVGAADFLSLAMATDPHLLDVAEMNGEDPQTYYKRLIVEHCLYGVDLNPLAVELAKLSLWLYTVSRNKVLSFLDHHLRCGNSLVGARVAKDLNKEPPIVNLHGKQVNADNQQLVLGFTETLENRHLATFLTVLQRIGDIPTRDAASEHLKQTLYAEMEKEREKFRAVANCWLAPYFAAPVTAEQYQTAVNALCGTASEWEQLAAEKWFTDAQTVASRKHFFHWELEFPEIFFRNNVMEDEKLRGFDAVIGNPPYIDIKGMATEDVNFIFLAYPLLRLRINVFAAFVNKALTLTQAGSGQVGVIVPTALLTQLSYANLRQQILREHWIRHVVKLPNELFGSAAGEVKVDTCIIVIGKQAIESPMTEVLVYNSFLRTSLIDRSTAAAGYEIPQGDWTARKDSAITLSGKSDAVDFLIQKIEKDTVPLETLCEFCLGLTPYDKYSGHTPEQITSKVFHASAQVNSTYKKLLLSGDVKRYSVEWNGENWIAYGEWLAAPREQRFFTAERILVQQIIDWSTLRIFAGYTDQELYNTQNQFNLLARPGTNMKTVLAVLNSRLISYFHRQVCLGVGLQRFQKILIKDAKTFPFHPFNRTTSQSEYDEYVAKAVDACEAALSGKNEGILLALVDSFLHDGNIDVVQYVLAFLAEKIMSLKRELQDEASGFITWLEQILCVSVNKFANKTTILAYHDQNIATLLAIMDKNQKFFGCNITPKSRNFIELFTNEYTRSMGKLEPLKASIEVLDHLIDKIVYELYGLTDDEIAIVEGETTQ